MLEFWGELSAPLTGSVGGEWSRYTLGMALIPQSLTPVLCNADSSYTLPGYSIKPQMLRQAPDLPLSTGWANDIALGSFL